MKGRDTMREEMIARILNLFTMDLIETGIGYLDWNRRIEGEENLLDHKIRSDDELTIEDLELILPKLSDRDLIFVHENQMCQKYR